MALRGLGGARLRRAAGSRAGIAGLAAALYLGAGLAATLAAVFQTDRFLGYGEPREGRVTPGDHLQTAYALWLPGHQLARGAEPWLDPYSFQPEIEPRINFAGWPFAALYGPLQALLGTVAGWNVFVLLTYVGAGGLTALWLRALGLGLGPRSSADSRSRLRRTGSRSRPAICSVRSRCCCRSRSLQWSAGKVWLTAVALASIPLSGQVHFALGAIPFVLAYALARRRPWHGAVAAAAGRRRGDRLVRSHSATPSSVPTPEVERYSATLERLPLPRPGRVRALRLPRLAPVAAVAGVGCLCFRNTISSGRGLALVLGLGALVPALLALGSNLPGYGVIWRHTPSTRPGCPSGCCRSPASAWPPSPESRSLVFLKHKPARGSSPRSPRSPSPPTCGCRSTTRSSPTRGTRSTPASPRRRRGGCSRCPTLPPDAYAGQRVPLLRDAGAK